MSDIRRRTAAGVNVGDTFSITRTFTEKEVDVFAQVTRDQNPIHFDMRFVKLKGLKGRICHGLLVAGMLTEVGGQMGWLASGMNFRFKKPVYFNDTVTCRCILTSVDEKNRAEAHAVFTNQDNQIVIEARLYGFLPDTRERRVLEDLLDSGD